MSRKRLVYVTGFLAAALMIGFLLPFGLVHSPAISKAQASDIGFLQEFLNEITPAAGSVESASLLTETGIAGALKKGRIPGLRFFDAPGMRAFYEARNYEPLWLRGSTRIKSDVDDVIKLMEKSWKHGLNPENYHISKLWELYKADPKMTRFELELAMSDAAIRYGRDLTGMRIDPGRIAQKSKYWQQPMLGVDILNYVAETRNGARALRRLAPQGELYEELQDELVNLLTAPEEEVQKVRLFRGALRPGNSHRAVRDVRLRLGLDPAQAVNGEYVYDEPLLEAVLAFQRRHGLHPDGIIGPQTAQIMNMTRQDKIYQILANLERMRWVEQEKPEKYVLVNVPSARLWAVERGRTKLDMPVIVGTKDRETIAFRTEITGIRFNPNWTVPRTIKREDYLPRLQEDPHYLTKRGIEMIEGRGREAQTIDPETIDWQEISFEEMDGIRMVQAPGRANPLGRVRILMANPYNIYLHDTNNKKLFSRVNRTLSSGCIRVAEPEKLAMFLMDGKQSWNEESMQAVFDRGRMRDIATPEPVPVYILYQTVWLDERGRLIFGADVYGRDKKLIQALKARNSIHIPKADEI